jgi:hypothetical protein
MKMGFGVHVAHDLSVRASPKTHAPLTVKVNCGSFGQSETPIILKGPIIGRPIVAKDRMVLRGVTRRSRIGSFAVQRRTETLDRGLTQ